MAAEWVASAAANTAGNMATECLSPYINYFFRFGRNVQEFKDLRERLKSKIERLKDEVEEAVRQTELIYEDVNRWLTRADKELGEAQSLEDEIEHYKCFSWCPSWGWRYCLSMKVSKKSICIKQLIDTCNFERLGQRPPLQGIEFLPSKDFKASQSSTVAFNGIIKALATEGVNMIGLYGMPGVGKTTLAKEVGKYAGEQKLFDKMVMVTMSQTPSINKIQDRIAEILGLEFKAKTEEGKAEELWRRLKGEKILIIIDDVWKKFVLDIIGISLGGENNIGCKGVLTTRIQSVCKEMNCEKEFKLEILAKDEAWALFKDIASPMDAKVIEVAKELAGECQGLPLAIKTVANALKNEDPEEWEAANQRLKDSRHSDNQRFVEEVYCCLELSYSYLKGENMKTCLLLCSLFPEDYDIPIDWLALIGIGEGLFRNIELMETQRKEIRLLLKALQRSGLLLEINDERDTVRMHDVVRDFAHWLTSTGDTKFVVKDKMTKWPMSENFESHTAIAIWKFNMHSFPDKIDFKNLKTLFLSKDVSDLEEIYGVEYRFVDHCFAIPATFFEGMKALRVLWLQHVKFSLEALQFLMSLRALFLVDCELIRETISSLISMEKLDILFVDYTDLSELFNVVGLPHLKCLSISAFTTDTVFPPSLLSRMTSLQELHVLCRNSINLWELSSLSCLTALSLCVPYDSLPEGFVFKKVQSYYIDVNYYINSHIRRQTSRRQTSRTLEINGLLSSLNPFKELFCNVEKLILASISRIRYIVSEGEARELNELTYLELNYCNNLECLIEPTKNLHHHHAKEVKSLQSLKYVKVEQCRTLKSIFSPCIAHIPLHLQQLSVRHCDQLEQVFGFARDHLQIVEQHQEENQIWVLSDLIKVELIHLPKLRFIWARHTHPVNLSSLNTMEIQCCDKLAYLFSSPLAKTLVHLQHISIESCNDLEHLISTEIENGDALCWPKLNTVNIKECHSLKEVFPIILGHGLPSLENIDIVDCPQLNQVFGYAEDFQIKQDGENHQPVLSNSINLKLRWLSDLRCISLGPANLVNLSSLNTLEIENCDKLAYLFSSSLARTLVHLEHISIESCNDLEHIISTEIENGDALCWPKLNTVNIKECNRLNEVFPIISSHGLPSLENIEIVDCPQLNQVFGFVEDFQIVEQDGENHQPILSNSINLKLRHLPELRCIWAGPANLVNLLSSLNTLEVQNCDKLAYLFSSSLARSLVHLECISIDSCNYLEHLISTEAENGDAFCWPKLNTVKINQCESLKDVFSITLAQGLPALKNIEIYGCPQLMGLFSMAKENDEFPPHLQFLKSQSFINSTDFSMRDYLVILPSLVKFNIEQENYKYHYCAEKHRGDWLHHFHLKDGQLYKFMRLICTTEDVFLQSINDKNLVPNLKPNELNKLNSLVIYECEKLECLIDTMLVHDIVDQKLLLSNLRKLALCSLPEMKCFWKGPTRDDSLQSLKVLAITDCVGLKYVLSASLAQSMVQLQQLHNVNCDNRNLQKLKFYNSGYEMININQPKRNSKNVDYTTILEIFEIEDAKLLSKVESLKLYEMHQLRGPIRIPRLQYLRKLRVWNCDGLKSLFSPMLARNLPQLTLLDIQSCIVLEEIIDITPASSSSAQAEARLPHISFPNLETIEIISCNNLKSLFPISVIHSLSKIKTIEIREATKLEQVFKYEAELDINQHDPNQKRIVLPDSLKRFTLESVSSLNSLAPVGYHFLFPSSCYLQIEECPMLTTSFSKDSNGVVHAITQEQSPEHVQNDVARGLENLKLISSRTALPPYKEEEESEVVDG